MYVNLCYPADIYFLDRKDFDWLSKLFSMHIADNEKNAHLQKLEKASENLKLFKVDLLDYQSLSAPISGCNGVFHVASPVPSSSVPDPEARIAHDGTCLWKHFHARQFYFH